MTRRRRAYSSVVELDVHAQQLELTDKTQVYEQLQFTPAPAQRLSSAVAGDIITIDGAIAAVRESCGAATMRGFWCLTCRQRLANGYQLELHTADGAHVVAVDCMHHGLETWRPE